MMFSVIIPNFNGRALLEKNLPYVLAMGADEMIVIDDASSDDSAQFISQTYPQIHVIKHEKNLGYGRSINDGVMAAKNNIVIFLNTDVTPKPDVLQHVIPHFENDATFAVTFHEPGWSWATGRFENGFFHHEPGRQTDKPHISLYASGGSAAFDKEKFLALGMYDALYHPFYWEDTDVSYRAWKRGWEIWWEPKAIVDHQTSATIKKYFSQNFRDYIVQRNELIFNWKNITDEDFRKQHKHALFNRIVKHPGYSKPFFGALQHIAAITKNRKAEQQFLKKTDKEVLSLFKT